MKIGIITKSNQKGQIVIPQEFRELLGIDENKNLQINMRSRSITITPIDEVITKFDSESSYLKLLEKTRGTWNKDDWTNTVKRRKKIELEASTKRKKVW